MESLTPIHNSYRLSLGAVTLF